MKLHYTGLGTYKRQGNGRFDSFRAAVARGVRMLIRFGMLVGVISLAFVIGGAYYSTSTVTAVTSVVEAPSPIMDRIADCESGNGTAGSASQFGKSGQVLISLNTNGTYDQGKYQINSIHNTEATKLGFNLSTEDGNTAYAKYLYANKGTGDWSSSAKCWQK